MLSIDDLKNFSLDSIITRNRDRVSLALATKAEIASLRGSISQQPVRATLNDWRVIALHLDEQTMFRLLGINQQTRTVWLTSGIEGLDLSNHLAQTANSVYRLAAPGEGQPPFEHLAMLVVDLRDKGAANSLGLPEIWMS